MKPKVIFLVGPTAIGKTEVAVILAKKIDAQIISCDSMQVYRGMDTITAKPSRQLRRTIPHYLMDIVSPLKEYNVSKYHKAATRKIKEIINRGKTPLIVGGTGLYMSILLDGIFKAKSERPALRRRLYKQAELRGSGYLYKKLKKIDAEAAIKIHPHDTKRIVRALEVYKTTGKPISYLQKQRQGLTDKYDVQLFCLTMERNSLYKRIEARIDKMFKKGLVKEVERLLKLRLSKTAVCALGIKELEGYFDGLYSKDEAKRLMKRNSRLYAKRQLTWFKKDKRIKWITLSDKEKPKEIVERIWLIWNELY